MAILQCASPFYALIYVLSMHCREAPMPLTRAMLNAAQAGRRARAFQQPDLCQWLPVHRQAHPCQCKGHLSTHPLMATARRKCSNSSRHPQSEALGWLHQDFLSANPYSQPPMIGSMPFAQQSPPIKTFARLVSCAWLQASSGGGSCTLKAAAASFHESRRRCGELPRQAARFGHSWAAGPGLRARD